MCRFEGMLHVYFLFINFVILCIFAKEVADLVSIRILVFRASKGRPYSIVPVTFLIESLILQGFLDSSLLSAALRPRYLFSPKESFISIHCGAVLSLLLIERGEPSWLTGGHHIFGQQTSQRVNTILLKDVLLNYVLKITSTSTALIIPLYLCTKLTHTLFTAKPHTTNFSGCCSFQRSSHRRPHTHVESHFINKYYRGLWKPLRKAVVRQRVLFMNFKGVNVITSLRKQFISFKRVIEAFYLPNNSCCTH